MRMTEIVKKHILFMLDMVINITSEGIKGYLQCYYIKFYSGFPALW